MAKKIKLDFTAFLWQDHKKLNPGYLQQCRAFLNQLPRSNPFEDTSAQAGKRASSQARKRTVLTHD